MAKYKYKCGDCAEKFELEFTKEIKSERICPKCKSANLKADYEQPEMPAKFESDNIRCFCALK